MVLSCSTRSFGVSAATFTDSSRLCALRAIRNPSRYRFGLYSAASRSFKISMPCFTTRTVMSRLCRRFNSFRIASISPSIATAKRSTSCPRSMFSSSSQSSTSIRVPSVNSNPLKSIVVSSVEKSLPRLAAPRRNLPCRASPCLASPCLVLSQDPCRASPCQTSPRQASPHRTPPCLTRHCPAT